MLNVLDHVKGLDFVKSDHITLAAAERENDVERLVLYYPALCISLLNISL